MTAGAKRATAKPAPIPDPIPASDVKEGAYRPYPFSVDVRSRVGLDLEGLEAHGDGISFRSPRPIGGGELVELTICRAILVEAEVVGCAPLGDRQQGYWVRARFHGTSPGLNKLICSELNRIATAAEGAAEIAASMGE